MRREVLDSGLKGYNKILEEHETGSKPMYRSKEWRKSARRMDKQRKKKSWLGNYKACIFVPPTPGGNLRKLLQKKELDMRPGGREDWAIKIIETAGKSLERVLVKTDPFGGNKCPEVGGCLAANNKKNQIECRRNNVGYKIPCKKCPAAYFGETWENMHTRLKSHLSKFNSKLKHVREGSAFWKHLENTHGGLKDGEVFNDYFEVLIVKAYTKPITRVVEEGTFIVNFEAELLNSKNEWHQPKIVRTTILQGGTELAGQRSTFFPRAGLSQNNDISMAVAQATPVLDVERGSGTSAAGRSTRSSTRIRAAAGGGRQ